MKELPSKSPQVKPPFGGIIRINKKRCNYAQIDNRVLEDELLSWRARGILCYLLSRPDNWQVRMGDLIQRSKRDGRDSVRVAISELLSIGYMQRQKVRDARGRLVGWIYEVYEKPRSPKAALPTSVNPLPNKTKPKRKKAKPSAAREDAQEFISATELLVKSPEWNTNDE